MSPVITDGNRHRTVVDMHPSALGPGGSGTSRPVVRARPVLPCEGCAHLAVCSIRAALDVAGLEVRAPESPHEALRIGIRIDVECRHFLEGAPVAVAPDAIPDRTRSAHRGGEVNRARIATAQATKATGGGSGQGHRPEADSGAAGADALGAARVDRPAQGRGVWIGCA